MRKSPLLKLLGFIIAASAHEAPSICMLSPLATATAGNPITASIDNPQGRPCQANLVFSNAEFLPINFVLHPMTCLGFQQAVISIPMEVPNGDATIIWECSGGGVQSCARVTIEGGSGKLDSLITQQSGIVECVVPIATFTTLATFVVSSSTIVDEIVSTDFSTSIMSTTSSVLEQAAQTMTVDPPNTSSTSSSSYTGSTITSHTSLTTTSDCSCGTSQTSTMTNNGSPFN